MNALKCDRCGKYYDYDPTAKYNYISFGHKDIIPSKKITTKDICPECMEKFIHWLENPNYTINVNVVDPEKCKRYLNEKFGISEEEIEIPCKTCNDGVCEQCIYGYKSEEKIKKMMKRNNNDDERVNELYKEAEDISNRAGEEKVE